MVKHSCFTFNGSWLSTGEDSISLIPIEVRIISYSRLLEIKRGNKEATRRLNDQLLECIIMNVTEAAVCGKPSLCRKA
ncbi:hypothetical protein GJ744_008008 [Endocarpon pusillum]|uniref:Uncharacterized protein n=1 Tax=Endocarpon pusillum TaxID=364733 RepID=A0A8H7AHZ0_9EURO|nr:hypothetical protein GJ744_008008 [Endocarpon pusillum]